MKWLIFGPEIYFLAVAAVFLILSLMRPSERRDFSAALILAGLGVAVTLATFRLEGSLFHGAYRVDLFSQLFKGLLSVGFFLVVCLCSNLKGIHKTRQSEFYLLLTTCTLGMMLLVSSLELLTLYVALELASYSLYALVPLRSGSGEQMEAGVKYFLCGIATSALMLFGLACLFAATQTTLISELNLKLPALLNSPMAFIGLLLTLCGFFFKLALFPFHVWAPSVYQGAANQVTAFVATPQR
jgi:NADH-quinone oxidoreductase subunit N